CFLLHQLALAWAPRPLPTASRSPDSLGSRRCQVALQQLARRSPQVRPAPPSPRPRPGACVTMTRVPRRRISVPHPLPAAGCPLGIMISAGCGDSAAGRELSAPRPLRTEARLLAESLLRFSFGTSSVWPPLRKKKRLTKHSDNKDYSTCNLQDVHDDIENEFLIFTRYMRRSILNSLNIFSHVGPAWQDSSEGEKVAVKVIDKTKLDTLATGHLFQEVRCMKLVQHPNIVRLYEVIDTQTKLYLILELGDGGDMFDYIMKHEEGLNEDLAQE
ncbi:uncharacterized protein LOC113888673, partial [Bos indicus x Bos taurus]|uniref:uncharacterized protein LOC113888673 n=1 Tax=Bos indicus x Bos taurus TaxID=30522 RepID=UPI000F7D196F